MNREHDDLLLRDSVHILKKMRMEINERLDTGLIEELDNVIENLEKPMRTPKGEIEDKCLELLDSGEFSSDQLSQILNADPSTLSRTLKRLKEERWIVGSTGFGENRRMYMITNCNNCPWDLEKQECRNESIQKIVTALSDIHPDIKKIERDRQNVARTINSNHERYLNACLRAPRSKNERAGRRHGIHRLFRRRQRKPAGREKVPGLRSA